MVSVYKMGFRALLIGRMKMTTHELMVPAEGSFQKSNGEENYALRVDISCHFLLIAFL